MIFPVVLNFSGRLIVKSGILGPIWAKNGGLGPKKANSVFGYVGFINTIMFSIERFCHSQIFVTIYGLFLEIYV